MLTPAQDSASWPMYTIPVLGWRAWHVNENGQLSSVGIGNTTWEPAVNHARCRYNAHNAPAENCHCGFNTFNTLPAAQHYSRLFEQERIVYGTVALKGNLQIHLDGIRGEQAVVLGLLDQPEKQEFLQAASRLYDVPVLPASQLQQQSEQVAQPISTYDYTKALISPMSMTEDELLVQGYTYLPGRSEAYNKLFLYNGRPANAKEIAANNGQKIPVVLTGDVKHPELTFEEETDYSGILLGIKATVALALVATIVGCLLG